MEYYIALLLVKVYFLIPFCQQMNFWMNQLQCAVPYCVFAIVRVYSNYLFVIFLQCGENKHTWILFRETFFNDIEIIVLKLRLTYIIIECTTNPFKMNECE